MSGIDAARMVGVSPGQLSRIESAQRTCDRLRVSLLLGLYRAAPDLRENVLDLVSATENPKDDGGRRGYWVRPHGGGPADAVATVRYAHAAAATIACVDPAGISPLAQAVEFMEADLRRESVAEADMARWIDARREYQEILYRRDGPAAIVYLRETTLRTLPVREEIRQLQFIHLSMTAGQGRPRLRVVPVGRDRAVSNGGFSLLGFADAQPAVCVPCDTVTLVLEGDHVDAYQRRLDEWNTIALSEQDSRELVTELAST